VKATVEHRETFREKGWVHVPGVLDAGTVDAVRRGLDAFAGSGGVHNQYGILGNNVWEQVPAVEAVVRGGPVAQVATMLLDANPVTWFQDNLVWKPAGSDTVIDWHQDFAYWPLEAPDGLVIWLCFDDADEESGCLHYISGTHTLGERRPEAFLEGTDRPPRDDLPALAWRERIAEAEAAPARAGDVLAHSPLVWHMSKGNRGPAERRALSTSWLTPAARWNPEHAAHPLNWRVSPVRGAPVEGELFPQFCGD
jgi:ectoine hydroxylase-related dioxygenase (phytanoyl-CoA dioxygenase family)